MQTTSQLYKDLLNGYHKSECKLDVYNKNGNLVHSFGKNEIYGMRTSCSLFPDSSPCVGGTVSGEIDIDIMQGSVEIPRMAMLRPYVRLTDGVNTSEWLPKGVFWVDTRKTDYRTQVLHIHGFDAMLKAEQTFFTINLLPFNYQMYDYHVLDGYTIFGQQTQGVLAKMGVQLEANTRYAIITNGEKFTIPIPSDVQIDSDGRWSIVKGTGWTCRELLNQIASCYCGNFCFDEFGKLKLVKFPHKGSDASYLSTEDGETILFGGEEIIVSLGEVAYLNQDVESLDVIPAFDPYSSVTVYLGDGEDHYTYPLIPPSTGRNLRVDTKARTSTLINRIGSTIYNQVQGYAYRPFAANGALLDPAAQLGDYVIIDGVEYVLCEIDTDFDALCAASISSPQDNEVDHEYPFMSGTQKKTIRDYVSLDNRVNKIETLLNPLKKILEDLIQQG